MIEVFLGVRVDGLNISGRRLSLVAKDFAAVEQLCDRYLESVGDLEQAELSARLGEARRDRGGIGAGSGRPLTRRLPIQAAQPSWEINSILSLIHGARRTAQPRRKAVHPARGEPARPVEAVDISFPL
ncbi:hypothetical protein [Streptosporangium sp. V21-05]|uniref:hypothetical protein n=1 Tax=Streptosporangium sp. V21-05 TaxID=3446115 RepID=UPI003F52F33B